MAACPAADAPMQTRVNAINYAIAQAAVLAELSKRAGGMAMSACRVQTSDGVRTPDAVWVSAGRFGAGLPEPLTLAPEICVEIRSPAAPDVRGEETAEIYTDVGAVEVWVVAPDGTRHEYRSTVAPALPHLRQFVPEEHQISIPEVAQFFKCTEEAVVMSLRNGDLPGVKIGRSWVIPRHAFFRAVNELALREAEGRRLAKLVPPPEPPPVVAVLAPRRGRPRLPRTV